MILRPLAAPFRRGCFFLWAKEKFFFKMVQQTQNLVCHYSGKAQNLFLALPCFINKCRKKLVLYPPH
jgi:hypothetical protein